MVTGLELNLQIALIALGIAALVLIYLYSRFHDKGMRRSRARSAARNGPERESDAYMTDEEYRSRQEIPDFLGGSESGGTPKAGIGDPCGGSKSSRMADHSEFPDEGSSPDDLEPDRSVGVHGVRHSDEDNDTESPVLTEQIYPDQPELFSDPQTSPDDRAEFSDFGARGEAVTDGRADPPMIDPVRDVFEDSAGEETGVQPGNGARQGREPSISLDPLPEAEEDGSHAPHDLFVDSAKDRSRGGKAVPSESRFASILKGTGFFNRFRKQKSVQHLKSDDSDEFQDGSDSEYDDVPDESEVVALRESEEYSEPEHPPEPEPAQEKVVPRFEYPEIQGFDRLGQVDYWVKLSGGKDLGREALYAQYRELFAELKNSTRIYGIRTTDREWVDIETETDSARFLELVVTLQLVDSSGAITRSELNPFTDMVTGFSEAIGKNITFMAPLESAAQQARALSECVQMFDYPCMVFVVPERPDQHLSGGAIAKCARQMGLETHRNNYFVRTKTVGRKKVRLYGVANLSDEGTFDFDQMDSLKSPGVVFFFRPLVHESPGSVLSEMASTAKSFAGRMGANTITPEGNDLTVEVIGDIRAEIESKSMEMEACGLHSGGDAVMRIFESDIVVSE